MAAIKYLRFRGTWVNRLPSCVNGTDLRMEAGGYIRGDNKAMRERAREMTRLNFQRAGREWISLTLGVKSPIDVPVTYSSSNLEVVKLSSRRIISPCTLYNPCRRSVLGYARRYTLGDARIRRSLSGATLARVPGYRVAPRRPASSRVAPRRSFRAEFRSRLAGPAHRSSVLPDRRVGEIIAASCEPFRKTRFPGNVDERGSVLRKVSLRSPMQPKGCQSISPG